MTMTGERCAGVLKKKSRIIFSELTHMYSGKNNTNSLSSQYIANH